MSHNHGMWDRHSMVWNHFIFHNHCMITSQYIVTISKDSQSLIISNSHNKINRVYYTIAKYVAMTYYTNSVLAQPPYAIIKHIIIAESLTAWYLATMILANTIMILTIYSHILYYTLLHYTLLWYNILKFSPYLTII